MKKILLIESWNCSPHLETSLEIAKNHADIGDHVTYIFCGHDTPYTEGISLNVRDAGRLTELPEVKGIKLINSSNIKFIPRCKLPHIEVFIPSDFKTIDELIDYRYKNCRLGLGVASSLISNTKNSIPDVQQLGQEIRTMLTSSIRLFEYASAVMTELKPDVVYVFNGRFCNHRPVMEAARNLSIKTIFHERGSTDSSYGLTDKMPHDQAQIANDILTHWEIAEKKQATKMAVEFFEQRLARATFDSDSNNFLSLQTRDQLPRIDKSKKVFTYFSSSDDEYAAVGDVFEWKGWMDQYDAVNDLIRICARRSDIHLFIRLHPHLSQKSIADQNKWLALNPSMNATLISFDSDVDSYALLAVSDVVITSGSTVGMESVYQGTPTITVGPAYYSRIGATYKAENHAELEHLILNQHLQGDKSKSYPFGYYMSTWGRPFQYYQATSSQSGLFLGVDLQAKSKTWYRYHHYKSKLTGLVHRLMTLGRKFNVNV